MISSAVIGAPVERGRAVRAQAALPVLAAVPFGSLLFGSLWTARGIREDVGGVDVGA